METENSNTPKQRSSFAYDKIVFVEYSSARPGQHFMTIIKTVDGKRRIIGRVLREYDKENNRANYIARDASGNRVFEDVKDLNTLKKQFIEHSKTLELAISKDAKQKELAEEKDREKDLEEIRERNADKEQDRGMER